MINVGQFTFLHKNESSDKCRSVCFFSIINLVINVGQITFLSKNEDQLTFLSNNDSCDKCGSNYFFV